MKNMVKKSWFKVLAILLFSGIGAASLVYAQSRCNGQQISVRYEGAGSLNNTEIYCLDQLGNVSSSGTWLSSGRILTSSSVVTSGGIKIGNSAGTPTLPPTSTTGANFGVKVPYVNAGGVTISAGSIVTGSTGTASINAPGIIVSALSTTTVLGINEFDLAAGATGYMTISGYALALTTGVVTIGDMIVTTNTASVNGYGGSVGGSSSTLNGTVVGIARQQGTAAGGLTLIQVGPR